MLKIKTQNKYKDINISIPIDLNSNLSGYQQEINKIIYNESEKAINPEHDVDIIRYKHTIPLYILSFKFYNYNDNDYDYSYLNIGFTEDDFNNNSLNVKNSYYIFILYDNFNSDKQNIISKMFFTNIHGENSYYNIKRGVDLYYYHIPHYYFNENNDISTGYTKILFYNATNGKYHLFYNKNKENLTTEERFYFKTYIDNNNKTWEFTDDYITGYPGGYFNIYEEHEAVEYINKINKNNDNFIIQKPLYPDGEIFDIDDGTYYTII